MEKSGINLPLALLNLGYIEIRDTDIAPAVRKVRRNFPEKQIIVFSPFNYRHSTELIRAATHYKTIKYTPIKSSPKIRW